MIRKFTSTVAGTPTGLPAFILKAPLGDRCHRLFVESVTQRADDGHLRWLPILVNDEAENNGPPKWAALASWVYSGSPL